MHFYTTYLNYTIKDNEISMVLPRLHSLQNYIYLYGVELTKMELNR